MLPKISLGDMEVSRLIIGGNPFCGNSHMSGEKDEEMLDYFTMEKVKETLFRCQELGIDTTQLRGDVFIFRLLREFHNQGGRLNWIAQTASEYGSHQGNVNQIVQNGADAIYHHGSKTDSLFKDGKIDELKKRIEVIKDSGKPAGLATHMPQVIEYVEENKWGLNFYKTSVYNISRIKRKSKAITGKAHEGEPFYDEDREKMYKIIQAVDKPCLVFKILGAGRKSDSSETVKAAFKETFSHIKEKDAVVVGMYPREKDQVQENVELVKAILEN